jgi:hypothetical protein
VWERISTSPELASSHGDWESATAAVCGEDRYKHPTWSMFVSASDARTWPDSNDAELEARAERAGQRRKTSATVNRKVTKKHGKVVSQEIVGRITAYRDERETELAVLYISPSPPLWIRNRTLDRCVLVADAWQAREMFRQAGMKPCGRDIVGWLDQRDRLRDEPRSGVVSRVNEALRRANRLVESGEWPEFEPLTTAAGRNGPGMHPAVVSHQLGD